MYIYIYVIQVVLLNYHPIRNLSLPIPHDIWVPIPVTETEEAPVVGRSHR